jgi:sarcosine oxidase
MQKYDVIVVGLGAMGSATTYQLAKAGANVLGIDRFTPPHSNGSSHGDTRITRLAIGESEMYTPLAKRSQEIWREIEKETAVELLVQCGELLITVAGAGQHGIADFIKPTFEAAERNNIPFEKLATKQLRARFPQFQLTGNEEGYYEPDGGYVWAERSVKAQLDLARKYGASLNLNEKVFSYTEKPEGVIVTTGKGEYEAQKIILTAGPWINELVTDYPELFKIYRQVLYWFDLQDGCYETHKNMPTFIWLFNNTDQIYGFPAVDGQRGGIKVATEQYSETTSPYAINRTVTDGEIDAIYSKYIDGKFPGVSNRCLRASTCMYTTTPDSKFIIDYHPGYRNVIVASPCSGHGFKHSAAIGEALSQIVTIGKSEIDLSSCSFSRLLK